MKPRKQHLWAFTLTELLVVIAIIGVLAGMLLPALSKAKINAQVGAAKTEMKRIATAVDQYKADYGRYPSSPRAMIHAAQAPAVDQVSPAATSPDFTYGTFGLTTTGGGVITNGSGITPVYHEQNNSELMGILMAIDKYRDGSQSSNVNHSLNPRKHAYLEAKPGEATSPGLGPDGVLRDPWKNPYIVTIDMNYDGYCRDSFYRFASVSQAPGASPSQGLYGLVNTNLAVPAPGAGSINRFEYFGSVMVWSLGPDGYADFNLKANVSGAQNKGNKDNVLSWQ
jgi:prepilin-type N-terminal cleavage/methylation domain-containing protein